SDRQAHLRVSVHHWPRCVASRAGRRSSGSWSCSVACTPDSLRSQLPWSARTYGLVKDPGWIVRPYAAGWVVTAVNEPGPAAGRLERGDRLLAINGDDRAALLGFSDLINLRDGDIYRVDVERHGHRVSVALLLPVVGAGICGPSSKFAAWRSSSVERPWGY